MDNRKTRKSCRDIWNADMCDGATYSSNDIPYCPTTANRIPSKLILWDEAKHLYKLAVARKDKSFHFDAYVCFYFDDYRFDGPRGIWNNKSFVLKVLQHFDGVITPDFSTYQDFPDPIKRYNTYRMRAYGRWLGENSIKVINNVRWGSSETWSYCWDGIPHNSIVAIGTVGGNPKKLEDRQRFESGLAELVRILKPHTIIVYGSANYKCFDDLRKKGIKIVSFPSHTAVAFERRRVK